MDSSYELFQHEAQRLVYGVVAITLKANTRSLFIVKLPDKYSDIFLLNFGKK